MSGIDKQGRRRGRWWLANGVLAGALSLALLHPMVGGLIGPFADLFGALGLDGLLLLIEMQLLMRLGALTYGRLSPWLTRFRNRHLAPRFGQPSSSDLLAQWCCSGYHWLLCHDGRGGSWLYMVYLAMNDALAKARSPL